VIETFLEVDILTPDNFLKIKETLTRIGIPTNDNTIVQTCHILHKQGRYYLMHFKELLALDGKTPEITKADLDRRTIIARRLESWGLLNIRTPLDEEPEFQRFKVISHTEKSSWKFRQNYSL
jgi:hypothetical protein